MVVAGADSAINSDLERGYAIRANSRTIELAGASHSVYVSNPKEVAVLIEEAASHAQCKYSEMADIGSLPVPYLIHRT